MKTRGQRIKRSLMLMFMWVMGTAFFFIPAMLVVGALSAASCLVECWNFDPLAPEGEGIWVVLLVAGALAVGGLGWEAEKLRDL